MLRRLLPLVWLLAASSAFFGCEPPVCCAEDEECGEGLGCFDGRCSFACSSDEQCAPSEVCARPLDGRAAGVCVAPGEDVGECRERTPVPERDAGDLHDAGRAEDGGDLPDVPQGCVDDQHEPNDSRPSATPDVPTPADLTICRLDEDWFLVRVQQGEQLEVSIRFPFARGDLKLELYGPEPQGNLLIIAPLSDEGRSARHVAVRNGSYAVRVLGAATNVQNRYVLDIDVGPPTDSGVVDEDAGAGSDGGDIDPPGDAGTTNDAGTLHDAGTNNDAGTVDDAGTLNDAGGFDAGGFDAGVFDAGVFDAGPGACVDDALEDNDNRGAATLLLGANPVVGGVLCPDDPDLFRLPVGAGETISVSLVYGAPPGMRLTVSRAAGGTIATSATGTGLEQVTFQAVTSGSVILRLAAVVTGVARPYELVVTRTNVSGCIDDAFEPNDSQQQATPIALPAEVQAQLCSPDPDFFGVAPGNRTQLTVDLVDQPAADLVVTILRRVNFSIVAVISADDGPTVIDLDQPSGPLLFIVAGAQDAAYTLTIE